MKLNVKDVEKLKPKMTKPIGKEKIKCPTCGKPMEEQPPSRDYTNQCSKCFAKSFVNSIFTKNE